MTVLKNTLYSVLGLLTAFDCLLLVYMFFVSHHVGAVPSVYFREPDRPLPTVGLAGYTSTGVRLLPHARAGKGWAVRYGSSKCEFCRVDEAGWKNLKSQLVAKGYHIYDVFPDAQDIYAGVPIEQPSETQLSFVNVAWMKQYRLTGTPTTLLFDGHGSLIWAHAGVMSEDDQRLGLQAAEDN